MPHAVRMCSIQLGRRHVSCRRYIAVLVLITALPIFLVEWSMFEVASWFWEIPPVGDKATFSILLIGDPQLIGYRKEAGWIGPISRWDSDRYLRKGYVRAVNAAQPSLEVFMGDLFDEGVEMTQQEFHWTMTRWKATFPSHEACSRICIPGDNDVGGEMEPVYLHLVKRFEEAFPSRIVNTSCLLPHLSIAHIYFLNDYQLRTLHEGGSERKLKLLLSHMPILRTAFYAISEKVNAYRPSLIVSAHDHTAEAYTMQQRPDTMAFQRIDLSSTASSNSVNLSQLTEFQVPTVSYRMGVSRMGYGLLSVHLPSASGGNLRVEFKILWLPPRYPLLLLYLSLILFSIIHILFSGRIPNLPRILSLPFQRFNSLALAATLSVCSLVKRDHKRNVEHERVTQ